MEIRAEVRPRRARRKGWPGWAYYSLAGCLVLLTVPMYRYMLAEHPVSAAASLPVSVVEVAPVPSPAVVVQRRAPVRYPLADDQRCVGGAVVEVHGMEYRQIGTIQAPVHCAGRWADAPVTGR